MNLGEFKAGETIFYGRDFHNDTGTLEDPTNPTARLRAPDGTWSDLEAPTKQDAKTGFFGGMIDTTGFSAGQHIIRLAGTVATAKAVATVFCFTIVAADLAVNVTKINGSADAAARLALSAATIVSGAAIAGTLSTTEMTTNLTEATDDHYNGRIIIWTSGVLKDQATAIADYVGSTKKLVFTAVTEAPTAGDTFVIV